MWQPQQALVLVLVLSLCSLSVRAWWYGDPCRDLGNGTYGCREGWCCAAFIGRGNGVCGMLSEFCTPRSLNGTCKTNCWVPGEEVYSRIKWVQECHQPNMVALTFDDGPAPLTTPTVLDALKQHGVKATFFVLGKFMRTQDQKDTMIRAVAEGHALEVHGYTHTDMVKLGPAGVRAEITKTAKLLTDITGYLPRYVRPPFGSINKDILGLINELGYRAALWGSTTLDWSHEDDPESIFNTYVSELNHNHNTFVMLQHDTVPWSVPQVSKIIQFLKLRGVAMVSLDECLGVQPSGWDLAFAQPLSSVPQRGDYAIMMNYMIMDTAYLTITITTEDGRWVSTGARQLIGPWIGTIGVPMTNQSALFPSRSLPGQSLIAHATLASVSNNTLLDVTQQLVVKDMCEGVECGAPTVCQLSSTCVSGECVVVAKQDGDPCGQYGVCVGGVCQYDLTGSHYKAFPITEYVRFVAPIPLSIPSNGSLVVSVRYSARQDARLLVDVATEDLYRFTYGFSDRLSFGLGTVNITVDNIVQSLPSHTAANVSEGGRILLRAVLVKESDYQQLGDLAWVRHIDQSIRFVCVECGLPDDQTSDPLPARYTGPRGCLAPCWSNHSCIEATCAADGACVHQPLYDGSECPSGTCVSGQCRGYCNITSTFCTAPSECYFEGSCVGGVCAYEARPDGTVCQTIGSCVSGVCVLPNDCAAVQCSTATNDPCRLFAGCMDGQCLYGARAEGSPCTPSPATRALSASLTSANYVCEGGLCVLDSGSQASRSSASRSSSSSSFIMSPLNVILVVAVVAVAAVAVGVLIVCVQRTRSNRWQRVSATEPGPVSV